MTNKSKKVRIEFQNEGYLTSVLSDEFKEVVEKCDRSKIVDLLVQEESERLFDYDAIQEPEQNLMIFADHMEFHKKDLVDHYEREYNRGENKKPGIQYLAIIHLPSVDDIIKQKGGMDKLSDFELTCYVFTHGVDEEILKLKLDRFIVRMLSERYDAFLLEMEEVAKAVVEKETEKEHPKHKDNKEEHARKEGMIRVFRDMIWNRYKVDSTIWLRMLNEKELNKINDYFPFSESYVQLQEIVQLPK